MSARWVGGWAALWVASAGAALPPVAARLAQATAPLERALAHDDRHRLVGEAIDLWRAGEAYAAAGPAFCADAHDRMVAAEAAGVSAATAGLARLASGCQATVRGLPAGALWVRPVPGAAGGGPAAAFAPLPRAADGTARLWPGAWQVRLGTDDAAARFWTTCAAPGATVAVDAADVVTLPAEPKARSKVHNTQGQRRAATDRCAAAAAFRLAAEAALSETYLFNAGLALATAPADCHGARAAFDAFLARCNVCRDRADVLARRKALEQTCEVSLAVKAPPGARVRIDDVESPTRLVFPGRHRVRVTAPGQTPDDRTVWVAGDTRVEIALTPEPPTLPEPPAQGAGEAAGALTAAVGPDPAEPPARSPVPLSLMVGGGVLAVVGGGFLVGAEMTDGSLADLRPNTPGASRTKAESLAEERDLLRLSGGITTGVGLALVGLGAWLWLDDAPAGGVTVAPMTNGFAVGGQF